MAHDKPNPDHYFVHFPNFRNVAWNSDPIDVGNRVEGAIGQTIARNAVFDSVSGLWRFASGDALGRTLVSIGAVSGVILSSNTVTVPGGGILLVPANTSRAGVYIENLSTESCRLGYTTVVSTGIVDFPNDTYDDMQGYTGPLVANAGVSVSVIQILVIEYQ